MAEGLATLDGEELDLDQAEVAFAAAMAAPPADGPSAVPPSKRPPEPAEDPERAPHGWTWADGQWRPKKAAGRPRRDADDKPRVTTTHSAPKPPPSKPTGSSPKPAGKTKDYRKPVVEVIESAWFVLATAPVPDQAFGKDLSGLRTNLRVQAALLEGNADGLASGLNTVAQHNRFVAKVLDRLSSGEAGLWVLPACMMLAPFVAATGQLWSGSLGTQEELEQVAANTEERARAYVKAQADAVMQTQEQT